MNIRLCGDVWERNIKYSWVRRTLKNVFPIFFFFLKKEKQIAICLAYFVCVHVYAGIAWGEVLNHAMRQNQDDVL